jgi:glycerol-3-phosphate acyltransferase PlsY
MLPWLYTIPLAFLAGSIPFGLLIGRAKRVDVRTLGSGNIGATNVGRVLGRPYFFLCFTLDFLKGFLPVLAAGWLAGLLIHARPSPLQSWLWVTAMLAPVLGHVLNPWLKLKGGKGVATSLGALLAVWPHLTVPALGVFGVFLIVLSVGRYMSLASVMAGMSLPMFVETLWLWRSQSHTIHPDGTSPSVAEVAPYLVVSGLLAILVIWTHRANIQRLQAGTEPKIGTRSSSK